MPEPTAAARVVSGAYAIRNARTGRVYVGCSANVPFRMNTHRYALRAGTHRNAALQTDWFALGPNAFTFEVLEEGPASRDLEMKWLATFGGNTYNDSSQRHGGGRAGTGRKPLEGGRVTAAFVLRQDQLDWIELQARDQRVSKSEIMRDLIDERRGERQ